ncbi:hypothetical protein NEOLEDRAFT_1129920 [Neolentinus lepideus HHB14362 ss-1]|uniref:Uncharacterized protein n=1 Tax=Neolentinus lepideus HHB14362 ss-1 TaxID=1314782 RepID=A0A165UDX6_9AGAM|nr:hypothetical protein NEOLEDRAFT_1129920 [Neolentinus lepideus HHB14362 ss-1]
MCQYHEEDKQFQTTMVMTMRRSSGNDDNIVTPCKRSVGDDKTDEGLETSGTSLTDAAPDTAPNAVPDAAAAAPSNTSLTSAFPDAALTVPDACAAAVPNATSSAVRAF